MPNTQDAVRARAPNVLWNEVTEMRLVVTSARRASSRECGGRTEGDVEKPIFE
jgi:hypothetical protein